MEILTIIAIILGPPMAHTDLEQENTFIRKSLVDLFLQKKSFPIEITSINQSAS